MFAGVSGARVGHDNSHATCGRAERFRQLTPYAEWHLSSGPDRELAVRPFRDGGARFKRSVRDVGDSVSGFADEVRRFEALFHGSLFRRGALARLFGMAFQIGEQIFAGWLTGMLRIGRPFQIG